jgi:hypothetical protein
VEQRSLRPNHCWQVDASVCRLYYLPGSGVRVIDEAACYKNKPGNLAKLEHQKVIRWVITDHYSGAFFCRYTQGSENTAGLLSALTEAMCRRDEQENDCLYGVPDIILADRGSPVRSGNAGSLFDALGIRLLTHKPGNPRAKGQTEQGQILVERKFESRLCINGVASLDELNAAVDAWRIHYNLTAIHTRHHRTRHAVWRTVKEENLRIPASVDALRELAVSRPEIVTVPHSLVLSRVIKGRGRQEYDVRDIPGIMPKMKVSLQINPFTAPCVDMTIEDADGAKRVYTLEPLKRDEAGHRPDAPVIGREFRAMPDTAADRMLKEMQTRAYGVDTLAEAEKAVAKKAPVYADIDAMADVRATPLRQYMPKRGRDLTLAPALKERPPLSLVDAVFELRNRFRALGLEWGPEYTAEIRERHGETVPADAVPGLLKLLLEADGRGRTSAAWAGAKVVSGGAA